MPSSGPTLMAKPQSGAARPPQSSGSPSSSQEKTERTSLSFQYATAVVVANGRRVTLMVGRSLRVSGGSTEECQTYAASFVMRRPGVSYQFALSQHSPPHQQTL